MVRLLGVAQATDLIRSMRVQIGSRTLLASCLISSGCAALHHVQVGQIDNRNSSVAVPFEILVSETGVSIEEAGKIAASFQTKQGNDAAGIAGLVALFQTGPKTGKPVYNHRYAERVVYQVHEKCPNGRVTGLMSVRETRSYPVVSGEIVKLTGYCLRDRQPASVSAAPAKED